MKIESHILNNIDIIFKGYSYYIFCINEIIYILINFILFYFILLIPITLFILYKNMYLEVYIRIYLKFHYYIKNIYILILIMKCANKKKKNAFEISNFLNF